MNYTTSDIDNIPLKLPQEKISSVVNLVQIVDEVLVNPRVNPTVDDILIIVDLSKSLVHVVCDSLERLDEVASEQTLNL